MILKIFRVLLKIIDSGIGYPSDTALMAHVQITISKKIDKDDFSCHSRIFFLQYISIHIHCQAMLINLGALKTILSLSFCQLMSLINQMSQVSWLAPWRCSQTTIVSWSLESLGLHSDINWLLFIHNSNFGKKCTVLRILYTTCNI